MTIGSLFSGIGGLELGLERAGFGPTIFQVESDPYCRAILEKNWPGVPKFTDVKKFARRIYDCDPEDENGFVMCPRCNVDFGDCECTGADELLEHIGRPDVICGGFPCQPFSVAGKQEGHEDERFLWPEFARIVRELGPRFVVAENVPGIRRLAADRVAGDLEALGYSVRAVVVGAVHAGAPHRRQRVFFLAHSQRERGCGGETGSQDAEDARQPPRCEASWLAWDSEPGVGRVAHGVPNRVDRLRALGNAVVPQVAEMIGRALLEATK